MTNELTGPAIDPMVLADTCDDRFFETFVRTYIRNKLTDIVGQNGLSERSYSTYVMYEQNLERASWTVQLTKDYHDERVKEAESLVGGLYEGLRRLDFRTSQVKALVDYSR